MITHGESRLDLTHTLSRLPHYGGRLACLWVRRQFALNTARDFGPRALLMPSASSE